LAHCGLGGRKDEAGAAAVASKGRGPFIRVAIKVGREADVRFTLAAATAIETTRYLARIGT